MNPIGRENSEHDALQLAPAPRPVMESGKGRSAQTVAIATGSAPQQVDLSGILAALKRRWVLASTGGIILAAIAGTVAYQLSPPPKHTARALVQVSSATPKVIFDTREELTNYRTYQQTQVALIRSRSVLAAAMANPEVAKLKLGESHPDPLGWLDREIKADFPGGSEILAISLSGSEPKELPAVVNAIVDAYMAQVIAKEQDARVARYDRLKTLFQKMQDEMKDKRKALRLEVEAVGLSDKESVSTKQQLAMQYVSSIRTELQQLKHEISRAEVELRVLQKQSRPVSVEEQLRREEDEFVGRDSYLESTWRTVGEKKSLLGRNRRISVDHSDPSVRRLDAEVKQLEADIAKRTQELKAEFAKMKAKSKAQQVETLDPVQLAQARVDLLKEKEKALKGELDTLDGEVRTNNVKYLDMHWLEDEIALTTQTARTVGAEVEALQVELQAPPRVRPIEKAIMPVVVDPLRKYKLSFGSAGSALMLFVGFVTFLEFQARRIATSDEVTRNLGIKFIGSLPPMRQVRGRSPSVPQSQRLVESVDEMRTMILHASRIEALRSVMVVGASKGEGKTTVACHLAASLARGGRKTLLIDCDLRNPSVHRILDDAEGPGVCELLRGEISYDQAIRASGVTDLDVLPAGHADPGSIQALAGDRLGRIFDELKGRYDFLIIDSAPVLLVSDTLMIGQQADAVVFSILCQVSRMPLVQAANDRLTTLGVRVLGAVAVGEARSLPTYTYSAAKKNDRNATSEVNSDGV